MFKKRHIRDSTFFRQKKEDKYIKEDEFSDFLNNVLREISESINMDKI